MRWNKEIDSIFFEKGVDLGIYGINNWAFDKKGGLEIVETLFILKVSVLGGDVLVNYGNTVEYTYDNWYCNKSENGTKQDFLNDSIEKARNFISNYHNTKYANILFTVVPDVMSV